MTTSILLALLLPACGSGGSVVLGEELEGEEIDEEVEEEEEEEEEEEVEPVSYTAEVVGFNERFGGDFCEGELELTLDDGVLTGSGSCDGQWTNTEIIIDGEVDGDDVEGDAEIVMDFGWGDPAEEAGEMDGQADEDDVEIEFEVELNFGGGGGGGGSELLEFTIEGSAD
jgi:hypothetical protein